MPIPGTNDIASARAQLNQLLSDNCSITPIVETVTSSGAVSRTAGTVANNVPCLIYLQASAKLPSGRNMNVGGREGDVQSHIMRLAYDNTIQIGDEVTHGSDNFVVTAIGSSDSNNFLLDVGMKRVK